MSAKTNKNVEDFIIKNYYTHSKKELINLTGVSNRVIRRVVKENNLIDKSSKKYTISEKYFSEIDFEEKAYWLGFLYAEDNIKYTSLCSTFSVYNNKMINDLINKGCFNNKTFIIEFPKLNNELIRHFIRGYFDGDGTICIDTNNKNKFGFTSGSYVFLKRIQEILISIGLTELKISDYKTYYRISWTRLNDLNLIYNYLYKNSTIFLNRKKIIFDKIINGTIC
jgi:intein/homing endonuclease